MFLENDNYHDTSDDEINVYMCTYITHTDTHTCSCNRGALPSQGPSFVVGQPLILYLSVSEYSFMPGLKSGWKRPGQLPHHCSAENARFSSNLLRLLI